jgi:hypothetical protein
MIFGQYGWSLLVRFISFLLFVILRRSSNFVAIIRLLFFCSSRFLWWLLGYFPCIRLTGRRALICIENIRRCRLHSLIVVIVVISVILDVNRNGLDITHLVRLVFYFRICVLRLHSRNIEIFFFFHICWCRFHPIQLIFFIIRLILKI